MNEEGLPENYKIALGHIRYVGSLIDALKYIQSKDSIEAVVYDCGIKLSRFESAIRYYLKFQVNDMYIYGYFDSFHRQITKLKDNYGPVSARLKECVVGVISYYYEKNYHFAPPMPLHTYYH